MGSRKYSGKEPTVISVPQTKEQIDRLFQNSESWAIAFAQIEGQINNLFPSHPLLPFTQLYCSIFPKVAVKEPLKEPMIIFTDFLPVEEQLCYWC